MELLPYHLFCIFAGVRPKEVERLRWSDVNIEEKFIQVPEETSKTGIRRIVDMEPLLLRWLDYYIRSDGRINGSITPAKLGTSPMAEIRSLRGFEGLRAAEWATQRH